MFRQQVEYLTTNCNILDKLLGGGIPKRQVTLIYGEYKTGKTTLALQCAAFTSRTKLKTLYLDCEHTFSLDRLAQIASNDLRKITPYIYVFRLHNFSEQTLLIENLEKYLSKRVALIVIDTITSLYGLELNSPELIFSSNRLLNRQLAYLNQIAQVHNIAILITSQVHSPLRGNKIEVEPVAMRVLKYWSHNILNVKPSTKTSVRRVVIEKLANVPRSSVDCYLLLNETGVIDFHHARS